MIVFSSNKSSNVLLERGRRLIAKDGHFLGPQSVDKKASTLIMYLIRIFNDISKQKQETMQKKESKTATNSNAGEVKILQGDSGINLYEHQKKAFVQMTKKIIDKGGYPYKGLLVLPTGGGKTMTAARWIAENVMDKGIKVLWVAHRHELLEQAKRTFTEILAYQDVFKTIDSFRYRLISGNHDMPVNIKPDDDIIFSSKDSIRSEKAYEFLQKNWLAGNEELFLVIDEAHHAVARTYRKMIERIEHDVPKLRILGLTATPIRTKEKENGLLAKVFPNGMVYDIDLRTLIKWGILSEPKFEEVQTELDLKEDLDEEQIRKINEGFDIETIGVDIAKKIADNRERNNLIVNRYVENRDRYGKTIVFSVNIDNALALNRLFKEKGIKSDYVISGQVDRTGLHDISKTTNKEKISLLRKGELDVLINVNILTEGTDVPDVQTVFLTRPTTSRILMTQMMGRGLRGEKAGGTKDAYIVTFIDNWNEQIVWVNPEELYITDLDFNDLDPVTRKHITRLIAISKIEEFAVLSSKSIDPEKKALLESIDFIKRIPVGVYQFRYLQQKAGESIEKVCEILVYDNLEKSYRDLMEAIPAIIKESNLEVGNDESINDEDIIKTSDKCVELFFEDIDPYPAFDIKDIDNVLRYYIISGELPKFYAFSDRGKYDVKRIAQYIIDNDFGARKEDEYLTEKWDEEGEGWQTFFNYNFKNFRTEIHNAKERILHPADYVVPLVTPKEVYETRKYEDMSMADIRAVDLTYYKQLRDEVYKKYTNKEGLFFSAQSGYTSKKKYDFEIDHIKPLSLGGKTVLENLQLLTIRENRQKGNSYGFVDAVPSDTHYIMITCPDGTVISGDKNNVLAKAIKKIGVKRVKDSDVVKKVKSLNIGIMPQLFVSPSAAKKHPEWYIKVASNVYLTTIFTTTWTKIILEQISHELNLDWNIEVL